MGEPWMSEVSVGIDGINVTAASALNLQQVSLSQVFHNAGDLALGDAEGKGQVAHGGVRVRGKIEEHDPMTRHEGPLSRPLSNLHLDNPPDLLTFGVFGFKIPLP